MSSSPSVIAVVGLGFGDEGKGTTVDWLTRQRGARLVVRFNGGAQAAHNVVLPDGRHHTFAQFGSGTLAGADTFLSRFMLVNPSAALHEAQRLYLSCGVSNPLGRLYVDARAVVTTPYHIAANRVRETLRGDGRHGSCGMGIGETAGDLIAPGAPILRAGDLADHDRTRCILAAIRRHKVNQLEADFPGIVDRISAGEFDVTVSAFVTGAADNWFMDRASMFTNLANIVGDDWLEERAHEEEAPIIMEGAQGVLLDEVHGFHPHTTWSDCTFTNALTLAAEIGADVEKMGVIRTYHTRHGAGPFPTEGTLPASTVERDHNTDGRWQGAFRCGVLDLSLLQYTRDVVGGVDSLMVTHVDAFQGLIPVCRRYENDILSPAVRAPSLERQEKLGRMLGAAKVAGPFDHLSVVDIRDQMFSRCDVFSSAGPTHKSKWLTAERYV